MKKEMRLYMKVSSGKNECSDSGNTYTQHQNLCECFCRVKLLFFCLVFVIVKKEKTKVRL